jgi:hypothetical protein
MFVCREDFADWEEEQAILEFENQFTHHLDFESGEAARHTPSPLPLPPAPLDPSQGR